MAISSAVAIATFPRAYPAELAAELARLDELLTSSDAVVKFTSLIKWAEKVGRYAKGVLKQLPKDRVTVRLTRLPLTAPPYWSSALADALP